MYCPHLIGSLAGAPLAAPHVVELLAAAFSVRMALIAIRTVVHVPLYPVVVPVSLCLGMTVSACEDGEIRRIGVTVAARRGAAVLHGEPSVIESGVQPGIGVMTSLAGGRKACSFMIRIVSVVVVLLVTPIAICWQILVVPIHVTLAARSREVLARQWKSGLAVVEGAVRPFHRVMTQFALLWEPRLLMVGIVGVVVILQVTRHADSRQTLVNAAGVACVAIQSHVRTG